MNRSIPLKTVLLIAVPGLLLVLCLALVVGYLVLDEVPGLLGGRSAAEPPVVAQSRKDPGGPPSPVPARESDGPPETEVPILEDDFSGAQQAVHLPFVDETMAFDQSEGRGRMSVAADEVGLVVYPETLVANFTAEVDIYVPNLSSGADVGLVFRADLDDIDDSSGYLLAVGGSPTNELRLEGFSPDDMVSHERAIPETVLPESGPKDGAYHLLVAVQDSTIAVFVNGGFVEAFTDSFVSGAGVIGLSVRSDDSPLTVEFDNLVVYGSAEGAPAASGQVAEAGSPSDGPLTLGARREILVEDVGPGGGSLVVNAPGDPLDGLTIDIPSGAYPDGTTVEVHARPIVGHDFGPDFNPASPLIEIDAGEGLAEDFVTVRVPAEIAPDAFGMAFAYEAEDGALEGLTHLDADAGGVRFVSRHPTRDLVLSTVPLARLERDIETGFEHGVDDWPFRNYGTILSPSGHCAGQSLAAMYYFIEGLGPALYEQYDNFDHPFPADTPAVQWDDEEAWRLVAMAQETIGWESAARLYWRAFSKVVDDRGIYNAFAYSMLLTGHPQYVGIYTDTGGGHALIIYGKRGDSLLVSDPNYPIWAQGGEGDRTIDYDPGSEQFEPYYSGPGADNLGTAYGTVAYFGYRDLIDWQALGALWADLEAGVVGDDHFPSYRLMVQEAGSDVEDELWNNHQAESPEITVGVVAEFVPYLFVYEPDGTLVNHGNAPVDLTLAPGDNDLGFLIATPVGERNEWVGFDWVRVRYEGPATTVPTEIFYAGTWSGFDGSSGEMEFYAYDNGEVALRYRKTADRDNADFQPSAFWQLVNGTHDNSEFVLPFNDAFSVTGTFNESSVSGSGSNEYATFDFSGTRVD